MVWAARAQPVLTTILFKVFFKSLKPAVYYLVLVLSHIPFNIAKVSAVTDKQTKHTGLKFFNLTTVEFPIERHICPCITILFINEPLRNLICCLAAESIPFCVSKPWYNAVVTAVSCLEGGKISSPVQHALFHQCFSKSIT